MEKKHVLHVLVSFTIGSLTSFLYLQKDVLTPVFSIGSLYLRSNYTEIDGVICEEYSLRQSIMRQNRLICMITTTVNRRRHQKAIIDTWAPRCDLVIFAMARKVDIKNATKPSRPCIRYEIEHLTPKIKFIYFDFVESYYNLWLKTKLMFQYIVDEEEFDWILKVDDDSYVIMDNLRLFLSTKNSNDSNYYGFQYKTHITHGFNSGGSGYILSHHNAEKFVHVLRGSINSTNCPRNQNDGPEDVHIARCLAELGIYPNDTRDDEGRFRFLPVQLVAAFEHHLAPGWFWGMTSHPLQKGWNCCSDSMISFHYVSPEFMRVIEYLVYYVHPYSSRTVWTRIDHDYTQITHNYFNDTIGVNLTKSYGCCRTSV